MAEYFANVATKELSAFKKHLDLWRRGKLAKDSRDHAIQSLVAAIASCDQAHKTLEPIFEEHDI